jgi:hypothetical protein
VPAVKGYASLKLNGEDITPPVNKGYVEISRPWSAGDMVELVLPLEVQKVTADERIEADKGRAALKFGPLVYNVETVDQKNIDQPLGNGVLKPEWNEDLLGGVMTIKGSWADGTPLLAIPNYARNNRNPNVTRDNPGGSLVWMLSN